MNLKTCISFNLIFCVSLSLKSQIAADSLITSKGFSADTTPIPLTSEFNIAGAEKDICNNNIRILFPGGFGGMPDFENPKRQCFSEKIRR